MIKLLALAGLLFAAPVEAHPNQIRYEHGGPYWHSQIVWSPLIHRPRRRVSIRIDENCKWKPWKDKLVCKYE